MSIISYYKRFDDVGSNLGGRLFEFLRLINSGNITVQRHHILRICVGLKREILGL